MITYLLTKYENIEYMNSNCNKLLRKMLILRGVSEFDYNNETPEFIWYLRVLEEYLTLNLK